MKKILLIKPRGFCAGVERAIDIVERAIIKYGAPVYVRHEIVHNKKVVEDLKEKGAVFVKELDEVPNGAVVIFSAHGVSEKVERAANVMGLKPIDATCPLVKKVHNQARNYELKDREIILIGHAGHPEVEGTMGRVKKQVHLVQTPDDVRTLQIQDDAPVAYITQTTLSFDDTAEIINALKEKFSNIVGPELSDICYATQNRQTAVKKACEIIDVLLVIGSKNSSNSNRLRDVGQNAGTQSYLINDASDIKNDWFDEGTTKVIGITAGASAPESLVDGVIDYIKRTLDINLVDEQDFGIIENVKFNLPREVIR
jgi:4-hydroxy-3-methylbut-2-enyl diphosphate reductase